MTKKKARRIQREAALKVLNRQMKDLLGDIAGDDAEIALDVAAIRRWKRLLQFGRGKTKKVAPEDAAFIIDVTGARVAVSAERLEDPHDVAPHRSLGRRTEGDPR